ncbi:EAL domain-containing protein [Nodularia sp. UHCC 0506]|uniref:bifunctional diguanylate cyclase/phosphodiesterase n=1 Tax=Nodularia sp. UHCC 0506 TaxID=3110243 RepID=UPI002B21B038|nr:EAL domain-containing protein [Nodularia sp. UHCC 0506]MEA5514109.1 EAL domain-containing protein [Nodularia sp. UHCC 0506]
MEKQQPLFHKQISAEDWENTPENVKCLVESLLANTALSESQSSLIQFLDATPIAIAVHDSTGKLVYIHDLRQALLGEQSPLSEVLQIKGEGNKVRYTIVAFQDISDHKRPDLEHNESLYRQTIQVQTDLMMRSLPDTTITFANDALCLALNQSLENLMGRRWSHFVPPEDLDELDRKIAALSPKNAIFENINQNYRANNQISWTKWINLGIFDQHGQLTEIQSFGRDITALQERIQREKALNRVFQSIHNSLDLDTIFATATAATAELLRTLDCFVVQYLPEQGIWKHIAEFRHNPNTKTTIGFEIPDVCNPFAVQLKQLQVVQIADTTNLDNEINPEAAHIIPRAWLLIPLVVENTLWGSFTITASEQPFSWSNDQIELAQSVADQLEIAIQQANLYQQLQQELTERHQMETALREREAQFQNMAANVPGVIFRYLLCPDGSDSVIYMSPGCYRLCEVQPQEVIVDVSILWQMIRPEDCPGVQASVMESAQTLSPWLWAWRIITPSGQEKWLEGAGRPIAQANGDIIWDTLIVDVTDRKQAEAALRESEVQYRLLAENTKDLVCLHDLNGQYIYVSPSCEFLLGYCHEEMLKHDIYHFIHPDDRNQVYHKIRTAVIGEKPTPIIYRVLQKPGNYIWFETLTKPIFDDSGQIVQLQTTSRDVTERIQVQNQLKYDALHDRLTGLPNRCLFMERLELAIQRANCLENYHFAVLVLDLDRFKVINDSLGHFTGDQLLIAIAQKLQATLRTIDFTARLGGDEFVILLEEIQDIQQVLRITAQILAELQTPLTIEGREIYTTASIGIVLGTKDYLQASHLLRDADIAMYRAKNQGKARYEIFDAEMHIEALNRLHLENDLRRAIKCHEFVLHYQPIVALDTGNLLGFEALIRWQHPTQGLKFPGEFIAVAEEIGLITLLDYWAVRTACEQLVAWQTAFPKLAAMKMSVNLSAQDLRQPDLLEEMGRILTQTNLNACCLTLEITESMLIEDIESTISLLSQLQERGIQISIDDFGTGYSSLSYLHRLPVDYLKVDRSFVHEIQSSKRNHQIVETIMALSDHLELNAIAEGIETLEQLERLQNLGYKFGQGYLFSKPLSQKEAEEFVIRNS